MTTFSQQDVISRLREVIDPCSAATRVPLSIVEMGTIESVEIVSRNVVVALRMMTLGAQRKLADQREFVRNRAGKSVKTARVQHNTNQRDH
jgi:metal-sulfur cluster biosynthetic enzyme